MEKVSIVIAAYNAERFLRETVESVLCQSYPEKELVIVDDGSTDGTQEVIAELARRTSLISIRQENKGIAGGRNTGLRACTGDYIAMLDHDDLWEPDKLEKQVRFLNETGADMVFSNFFIARADGRKIKYPPKKRAGIDVLDGLLHENMIYTSTVLFRKGVLDKAGLLDEQFTYCEDWDWWLRMARKVKIGYLPEYVATRREIPSSFSNIYKGKFLYYKRLYEKHIKECSEAQKKVFKKYIGKKCYIDAIKLMKCGLFRLGMRSYREAVKGHAALALMFPSLMKSYVKARLSASDRVG